VRFLLSRAEVIAAAPLADAVRQALAQDPLYRYAERHPKRRVYHGRGEVYGAPLPAGGVRIVVRHSRHGGMFAPLTRDLFFSPTRAPDELETALRLADAGVPTPEIVAYAIYRAGPIMRRADIATREIPGARDLGDALAEAPDAAMRRAHLEHAARLMRALTDAGARHPDLNVKNILLASDAAGATMAYVLDVDRVEFAKPGDPRITQANLRRLARSLRKQREERKLAVTDADIAWLSDVAGGHAPRADAAEPQRSSEDGGA
jgi:hypothetical protein